MSNMNIKPPSLSELGEIFKVSDLKNKLLFTLFIIVIFRLGIHLPIFGIDNTFFQQLIKSQGGQHIIGFLDLFSGGALGRVSILALGIGPFITSSIIIQLLAVVIPQLEQLQKDEGDEGRRKLMQYSRYLTVIIGVFQALVFAAFLIKQSNGAALVAGISPLAFMISSVILLTAGAVFTMWLSELITDRGVGNGSSLIIFCGILSGIPLYIERTKTLIASNPVMHWNLLLLLVIFAAAIVLIIVLHDATRKVLIVNPKRQVGNKVYGGMNTYIPFKLNPGGVMPIIFAIAIMLFPSTIVSVLGNSPHLHGVLKSVVLALNTALNSNNWSYYIIYVTLIIALTFFYASIMPNMQPKEVATNLKKQGASIPGIKPGRPTADALETILSRTIFIGAVALGIIALVPSLTSYFTKITTFQGIGATSLIIIVGVALDFINQIQTHLLATHYDSFLKNE